MKHRTFVAALSALLCLAAAAGAHEYKSGALLIVHPASRPSAGTTGAAYMTIENKGGEADRLLSAASPAAEKTELHSMTMDGSVMRMRPVDGIDLPAGGKAAMQPGGGFHVMLIGLKAPLKDGDRIPMTLTFAKSGKVEVEVIVQKPGGAPDPAHQH